MSSDKGNGVRIMGMTANQISLVRYVAENNMQKAKEAALCCCMEDLLPWKIYTIHILKIGIILRKKKKNCLNLSKI